MAPSDVNSIGLVLDIVGAILLWKFGATGIGRVATTAAEHKALQARWTQDLQALEAAHTELTGARAGAAKERERREQAEAEALPASGWKRWSSCSRNCARKTTSPKPTIDRQSQPGRLHRSSLAGRLK